MSVYFGFEVRDQATGERVWPSEFETLDVSQEVVEQVSYRFLDALEWIAWEHRKPRFDKQSKVRVSVFFVLRCWPSGRVLECGSSSAAGHGLSACHRQ